MGDAGDARNSVCFRLREPGTRTRVIKVSEGEQGGFAREFVSGVPWSIRRKTLLVESLSTGLGRAVSELTGNGDTALAERKRKDRVRRENAAARLGEAKPKQP